MYQKGRISFKRTQQELGLQPTLYLSAKSDLTRNNLQKLAKLNVKLTIFY